MRSACLLYTSPQLHAAEVKLLLDIGGPHGEVGSIDIVAVSYTHLDVYKRQALDASRQGLLRPGRSEPSAQRVPDIPPSFRHLQRVGTLLLQLFLVLPGYLAAALSGNRAPFFQEQDGNLRFAGPVSYTHLDVYKRQGVSGLTA